MMHTITRLLKKKKKKIKMTLKQNTTDLYDNWQWPYVFVLDNGESQKSPWVKICLKQN